MESVRLVRETAAVTMRALAAQLRTPFNLLPALSLRQLLAMLVLLTAVPLLALALVMSSIMLATERQANRGVLMSNARTLASLVDNEIDRHLVLAQTLATSPALQTGDVATFKLQALQALAAAPGSWVNLSDPSGRNVMSTLLADGVPIPPRTSLDFSKQVWASGQPQVSDVVMGSITKRWNAILEVPVFRDRKPLYSIIVGLNPDRFLAILSANFRPDEVVGLLDRKANFVARIPDHANRVGTPASAGWRASIAQSPEGFSENVTLEGEASLTPYVKTKHGWTVGIGYLKSVTEAPARRLLGQLGLAGGALTLLSLAFGLGLARRMSASMKSLLDASQTIAAGKTVAARALAVQEATEISRTLSQTSETLATRTADLRRAHDTFLNLVEHAPFGVYLVDSDFNILEISNGAEPAFSALQPVRGRNLAEVLRAIWPEKFANEAMARFRQTLETGEPFHQSSLQEKRRDTGIEEAYDWQIERVTLPDGKFGVVCYYYDLTGQKQAEAALRVSQDHQKFLLNELAHRMKNQLAVIQAMVGQTARNAGSLKQFQEQFAQRVQGLAVATDVLVAQRWSGAPLSDLVQRQLEPFVPSPDRLECDGPNVTISTDATQAIGLALHELATNAVKHGAWSSTGGRVKVSWQFVTNGAGNNLRVSWLEQDGPVVVCPTRKGFGHVVIENMAAQRVGGTAELVFAPEGLSWTLTIPNTHIVTAAEAAGGI